MHSLQFYVMNLFCAYVPSDPMPIDGLESDPPLNCKIPARICRSRSLRLRDCYWITLKALAAEMEYVELLFGCVEL